MLNVICNHYFKERSDRAINTPKGFPIGLIISPTAELCQQIEKEMSSIARHLPITISAIASSINMEEEWSDLLFANIIITTPGIINKFLDKKKIKLHRLLCIVVDEWDKILSDNKFMKLDITKIFKRPMPNIEQVICSSATFIPEAYHSLRELVPKSWCLVKADERAPVGRVHHFLKRIGSFEKRVIFTVHLLRAVEFQQALIFCNIQDLANDCVASLNACGFTAVYINSKVDQKERLEIVDKFREMEYRCLVTTDLVSRGLDVPNVNVVVNLDMAHDPETFLHRVGRVGRFGTDGMSVTLFKRGEARGIPDLKKATNLTLESFSFGAIPSMNLPSIKDEEMLINFGELLKEQESKKDNDFFSDDENEEEDDNKNEEEEEKNDIEEEEDNDEEEKYEENVKSNENWLFTSDYWEKYARICESCKPPFI